ncbi:hypothetical protein N431DRAFT_506950 [Stipitochalara longipes BDJ]|nr:hypothetical protein N431DRAFT_506950 [Stipitochalara longipes BDJ]
MFKFTFILSSILCVSNVIASPHQAMRLARDAVYSSSSYDNESPSSNSTTITGWIGTQVTEIPAPETTSSPDWQTTSSSNPPLAASPTSSSSSPPAAGPSTSCTHSTHSTHSKHSSTRTVSGGKSVETMTIQPGGFDALVVFEENLSNEDIYVEVRLSTWYKSSGVGHSTYTSPDAGGQEVSTTSTPLSAPTSS